MPDSHVQVDSYKKAAEVSGAIWNYKGLAIHALPAIHERAGAIIQSQLAQDSLVFDLASGSGAMCQRLKDVGMNPRGCDLVSENFRLHGEVPFSTFNLNEALPDNFIEAHDAVTALELRSL
jgi:hypothetical protein